MNRKLIITGIIFTAITIVARMLPHVPNVAPVAALALFAGVYLPKRWSLIVPIVAMFLSDVVVGFYDWQVMVAVYLGFILTVVIGWQVRNKLNPGTALVGSISGSIIFYLLSNAAVWAFSGMYAKNIAGLISSYVMALPFLRFSLVGDLAWTTVFFVAYQLVLSRFPQVRLNEAVMASNEAASA
jgi:hypothetical protein